MRTHLEHSTLSECCGTVLSSWEQTAFAHGTLVNAWKCICHIVKDAFRNYSDYALTKIIILKQRPPNDTHFLNHSVIHVCLAPLLSFSDFGLLTFYCCLCLIDTYLRTFDRRHIHSFKVNIL